MKIVHYPHPALRFQAKPISSIDKKIKLQIGEMFDLMYEAKGLGLAATQVALPFQLLVMNVSGDPDKKEHEFVYINPTLVERKGTMDGEEGCLSFPGLFQKVRRAKTVKIQAYNLLGEKVEVVASDLASRAWQHEIDHLNGVLFVDKLGIIGKLASRGALKELEEEFKLAQQRGEIPPETEIKALIDSLLSGS
ncbi:MAG: peptide deformylase [Planctomycetes bacterium]|nr:peptide deformylase [Planctomycetota bacterium]